MLKLKRVYKKNYVVGDLIIPQYFEEFSGNTIKTLELPYKDNQNNISCIPEGKYIIKPFISSKFGNCIEVCNVENRKNIRIHSGNTVANFIYLDQYNNKYNYNCESQGCILVGCEFDEIIDTKLMEQGRVLGSKKALNILYNYIKNKGQEELLIFS